METGKIKCLYYSVKMFDRDGWRRLLAKYFRQLNQVKCRTAEKKEFNQIENSNSKKSLFSVRPLKDATRTSVKNRVITLI